MAANKTDKKSGFTLTEVVVATFLAAVGSSMLLFALTTAVKTSKVAMDCGDALHRARGYVESFLVLGYNDAQLTIGGPYTIDANTTYTVSANADYTDTKDIEVATVVGTGDDAQTVTFAASVCRGLH